MNIPRRTGLLVAGWSTAAVLALATLTGVGIAFAGSSGPVAAPPAPSATPSGSAGPDGSATPGHRHHPGLGRLAARRTLHGEFVVKDANGTPVTMDVQRGQVTAVSTTSLSLRSEDGYTATYTVNSDTRVRVARQKSTISAVKTGAQAWVVARKVGSTATARFVFALS